MFDRAPYRLIVSWRGRDEGPPPDCRPEPSAALDPVTGARLGPGYALDLPNMAALAAWLVAVGRNVTLRARIVRRADDAALALWAVIARAPVPGGGDGQ